MIIDYDDQIQSMYFIGSKVQGKGSDNFFFPDIYGEILCFFTLSAQSIVACFRSLDLTQSCIYMIYLNIDHWRLCLPLK